MSGLSMPVSLILHILGLTIGAVLYVLLARLALHARTIARSAGESTGQQTILLAIASVGGLLSLALTAVDVWRWGDQPHSVGDELTTHYALLPLIVALLYVHRASQRETQLRQLAAEAELRALHAQLNPHFLFNALTTIGYLIREAPARATETLLQLTTLLRAALHRSVGELTTVREELALVEAYLAIERARFEERLTVHVDVPDDLINIRIPPLILQPLVENAVKHGIAHCVAGGTVHIVIDATDHVLVIRVSDTGNGVEEAVLARGRVTGVGLTNIEQRLKYHYGRDASVVVRSVPGAGTTAELRVPRHVA
jgi:LytS/YehU family sensor histidine kinase